MTDLNQILQQMTLEEKVALTVGATAWTTTAIERLGVPQLLMTDGPHGMRLSSDPDVMIAEPFPATCFPTASCLASTWNPALLEKMGAAMAEEAIEYGVGILLGPGANIKRSPLGGRNFEYFSEDPYLSGEMAAALITGLQKTGVGASLKHYSVNNQEHERFSISAEVDQRTLREIYLAGFEIAVKKAQPWSVMCAYNKVNGTLCSEHHQLLTEILKEEWGFEGLVVSDWGAVWDRTKSLLGGLDLEMPGPQDKHVQAVVNDIKNGFVDEAILDKTVLRLLRIIYKAAETPKGKKFDRSAHHQLARKIAGEGMILLKNTGVLPLKETTKLAVIGFSAKTPSYQGNGSSRIKPTQLDSIYDEVVRVTGADAVSFALGYELEGDFDQALIDEAVETAKSAEAAVLCLALPASKESEGYDRKDLDLPVQQEALIRAVGAVQPNTIVILNNGSAIAVKEWVDSTAAILEGWMMGQAGAGAVVDILFGKINPSGKLSETFPVCLEDTPAYINWPGELGKVHYGEGLFVGYRYYDQKNVPVQFPFGHGLSYTSFEYSNAKVSAQQIKDTETVTVSVDVTNTGKVAGKEIVQVYVHDQKSSLVRPQKELKGFAKVELQPGETKTVTVPLNFRAFAFYHPRSNAWVVESGSFDVLIGSSAAEIHASLTLEVESTHAAPLSLNYESTMREWVEDPRGMKVLAPLMEQMQQQFGAALGGGEDGENAIGANFMDMLMEMPLVKVLLFQEGALPMTATEFVDSLLKQVYSE